MAGIKQSITNNNYTANKPKSASANIIKPELGYHALYAELDVHKETIAVAIAKPRRQGKIMKPRTLRGLQTDIEYSWLPFSAYVSNLL